MKTENKENIKNQNLQLAAQSAVIQMRGCIVVPQTFSAFPCFLRGFFLFIATCWPERALIARGKQKVPEDIATLSFSLLT